jgi:hypothetical protein
VVPVEGLLHKTGAEEEVPRLYWHGHELFADAFATAVTGPAHAEYCLRYRFEAATAHEPTPTHPSPARRMRMQLRVLDELASGEADGLLTTEATELRRAWQTSIEAAGQVPEVPADALLDPLEAQLLELLADEQLKAIRYRSHGAAWRLAESKLEAREPDATAAHVLNAAWRLRRGIERGEWDSARREQKFDQLTQKATAMLEEILAHG